MKFDRSTLGLEKLYLNSTHHLEALLLLGTSTWALNTLTLSKAGYVGLNFAFSSLLFLAAILHVFTSPNPSKRERFFLIPSEGYRKNAAPGLMLASLLPPLVLASKVISASTKDQQILWAHYLGLSLINGLSHLTQCLLYNLHAPFWGISLYISLLAPLIRFSGFILQTKNSSFYTSISLALYHGFLYLMPYFIRGSFTLGELSLICQGLSLLAMEALGIVFPNKFLGARLHILPSQMPEFVILCGAIIGILFVGVIAWAALRLANMTWNGKPGPWVRAATFYGACASTVLSVIRPLIASLIGSDPFFWVINYILQTPSTWMLAAYWIVSIVFAIGFSAFRIQNWSLNLRRKYFHMLATLMFIPGFLIELRFLYLGLVAALAAFVLMEYIRVLDIAPFHSQLHVYLSSFVDEKDTGIAILAHLYLLLGCALPIWLNGSNLVSGLSGILVLGISDAMASIIGKRFGTTKWPGSSKTVQGTLGFIISLFGAIFALQPRLFLSNPYFALMTLAATSFTGLLEAWSSQNDNLILPLYLMATFQLACQ
ncbi:dolichol kinase [Entomophthora muscae]|uniref:Dolichol kinase n=1 Tax=Entomophthora muscae TaxID=34485 RepID=A0ACC2UAB0_9FUNG|nr:dolichol kinase [Entomophthora muscae]